MAIINFPNTPTYGQTYTFGGVTYTWNNVYWATTASGSITKASPHDVAIGTDDTKYVTSYAVNPIKIPRGTMALWPSITPPQYWALAHGQSTVAYPNVELLYGANLPDTRGCFIRGYDNGRGYDAGRTLRSYQQDTVQRVTGAFEQNSHALFWTGGTTSGSGSFYMGGGSGPQANSPVLGSAAKGLYFDNSRQVRVSTEVRVKNISMVWIVYIGEQ